MKNKKLIAILAAVLVVVLAGGGYLIYASQKPAAPEHEIADPTVHSDIDKEQAQSGNTKTGLGVYSEFELFNAVPVMAGESISYAQAVDVGGGDYMITANGTALSDYQAYLADLEAKGFAKLADNGESGLGGAVYTAHYQKDGLHLIVTHIAKLNKTTITATEGTEISEHLLYQDAYVAGNQPGAQTKLHLLELETAGNSFVLQLKDGHFLVLDGGQEEELPHLIAYLESLTPEGEKPVIDAWFFSHCHSDHMGTLVGLSKDPDYVDRICVESVYFDFPGSDQIEKAGGYDNISRLVLYMKTVQTYLKNAEGQPPKVYHPHLGDRYYFSDFTIDIVYTMELLEPEKWDTWNASSTVMLLTIEGQRILLAADSDWCSQVIYTSMYDKDFFDLDIYQAPHHGINVYKQISNRLGTIKTIIYPTSQAGTTFSEGNFLSRKVQNAHLISLAQEALHWGNGTVILTFPYTVGSAETLPQQFRLDEEK